MYLFVNGDNYMYFLSVPYSAVKVINAHRIHLMVKEYYTIKCMCICYCCCYCCYTLCRLYLNTLVVLCQY